MTWIASSKCSPPPGEIRVHCKAKNSRRLVRLCELRYMYKKLYITVYKMEREKRSMLLILHNLFMLSCVKEKNRTVCKVSELMSALTYSLYTGPGLGSRPSKCSAEYLLDFAKFCRFNPQFLRHLQYINGRRLHTERNLVYFRTQDTIIFQLLFYPH